jgi:hypothetical protein
VSHSEHAEQPHKPGKGRTKADLEYLEIEFAHFNGYRMHPERLAAHLGLTVAAVERRQYELKNA